MHCPHPRGITVLPVSVPTVLPWCLSPSPRYYRVACPHYRGFTAVTAVFPLSPSPCNSLFSITQLVRLKLMSKQPRQFCLHDKCKDYILPLHILAAGQSVYSATYFHFNGRFAGEPGLATTCSGRQHLTIRGTVVYALPSPNQQRQSTDRQIPI